MRSSRNNITRFSAPGTRLGHTMATVLVGLIIAEGYRWNRSLSVHELHVAETHRNQTGDR